jgi:hypothetical protein
MSCSRVARVLLLLLQCFLFAGVEFAHPSAGIVVAARGRVYFLYHGVVRIEPSGQLTTLQEDTGGHWLALDSQNNFLRTASDPYKKVALGDATLLVGDGAPLAIGADDNL